MIAGKVKETTEKDYRSLELNSYSTLKEFARSRVKFYKKYILKEPDIVFFKDESECIILGQIVDGMQTLSQAEFDNKFSTITTLKTSGQMADFGDELWRITKKYIDENGVVQQSMESMLAEAFDNVRFNKSGEVVKFKGKNLEWIIENFNGSQEYLLYKERRQKYGKIVIDINEMSKSEKISDTLLMVKWSADILTHSTTEDFEVIKQLVIKFDINGVPTKSMLDIVHIDYINMTIQPYDLKVSYLVNNFGYSYWKQMYYLQTAVYELALRAYKSQYPEYEGYKILPIKFVVADSTLQSTPVIWETTEANIEEGLNGFTLPNGGEVKGVYKLIEELKWCMSEQIWTTPKEIFDNNGVMKIRPFNEILEGENED